MQQARPADLVEKENQKFQAVENFISHYTAE